MKAWEMQPGKAGLTQSDRPEPQPGFGQVLIKMRAASLNSRDLLLIKGADSFQPQSPLIPLSDGVGEIVAVGEGVTRVKAGDRVASIFMQKWLEGQLSPEKAQSVLGGAYDGVLAEYVTLHEDGVVRVPDHLSDEEAATLPCSAVTAWHALIAEGKIKPGETVLVLGTGGVSLFALQFAKLMGARVIATSSSDAKLERVRQWGASDGINYQTTPNWGDRIKELTNGIGVDHIVEVGGAGTLNQSLHAVRMGGSISLIGVLSGTSGEITTASILLNQIRVQGIYVGSREMFEAMNRAIALHQLKPIVDRVFPFAEVPEALAYLESGKHFGKIAISV
ncbi:MAG: NAD(P)-dependent alcohol dehydrogenase [Cyanobacteria bacterium QS_7_48_42]|nr:MAG: NAD(P)-dependent alcohol dehydrogenase [Cyanobacteria bacterium QS_7_48_42]